MFHQCRSEISRTQGCAAIQMDYILLFFLLLLRNCLYTARNISSSRHHHKKTLGVVSLIPGALDDKYCRFFICIRLTWNLKLAPNTLLPFAAFLKTVESDSAHELTINQCEIGNNHK